MRKPAKPKPFRAGREARRRARLLVGSVPPARRQEPGKRRAPKHKKQVVEFDFEN